VPETLDRNLALRSGGLQRGFKRLNQRLDLKAGITARLERRLLRRNPAPWVIAISQYVADQLDRHYRFDPARVRLVFNGVDPDDTPAPERRARRVEIRRQLHLADDDLMVLCMAHNFKLKGVARLIEALACRRGDAHARIYAVIVGRDNPAPYVELAAARGIQDRVLFSGPTQRAQAFFHAADLLAHPTFYDPCSRVVLEALAAGLPVITTRFNGAAERITDGQEGYVIDSPDDVDALADRIHRLADDEHRRACAARAPRAVEAVSMRQHAADVLALYEEIVRSGEPARGGYR
jgi:UDP-glucose:(heptosyl)LPS alpha-1,3-glucosyltransferase